MKRFRTRQTLAISTPEMRANWKKQRDFYVTYPGDKINYSIFIRRIIGWMNMEEAIKRKRMPIVYYPYYESVDNGKEYRKNLRKKIENNPLLEDRENYTNS